MTNNLFRRLRGALGNALLWAPAWFLAAFPLTGLFHVFGFFGSTPFWPIAIGTAQSLAGLGFLAGGAFSLYLGVAGRHHQLDDLRPARFALGSGLTAGLVIPAFGIIVNAIGGHAIPVGPAVVVASLTAVLTGVTAFAQIKVAQRALPPGEVSPDELASGTGGFLPDRGGNAV